MKNPISMCVKKIFCSIAPNKFYHCLVFKTVFKTMIAKQLLFFIFFLKTVFKIDL